LRIGRLLHAARLDIRPRRPALQPCDLVALGRNRSLQFRYLLQKLHYQALQLGRRQTVNILGQRHARKESDSPRLGNLIIIPTPPLLPLLLDAAFIEAHLKSGIRKVRALSDYRFRQDWEQFLATFKSPKVPKTVAEFVKVYEAEIAPSPLPVEDSVMSLLKTSLKTSTDAPEYKDFIENTMPQATAEKLAVFERHGVDALVFPYLPTFAQPIKNPVYAIDDPTFVKSDAPVPATMSGYSSVGFPSIVVPIGFGTQGLPMTITFFGKPYDDKKIIGFAYAYEQASKMRKSSTLVPPLKGEIITYTAK
jgi:amidase